MPLVVEQGMAQGVVEYVKTFLVMNLEEAGRLLQI